MSYCEVLKKSGHLLGVEALEPIQTAMSVNVRNGKLSVTDGPFAETKEQLGGYYLIDARDLNDAYSFQGSGHSPPKDYLFVLCRRLQHMPPIIGRG